MAKFPIARVAAHLACSLGLLMAVALDVSPQTPRIFTIGTPGELALANAMALAHVRSNAENDEIDADDLSVADTHVDQLSMAHVRVRQSFHRIPVFGGEAIVHFRADGSLFGETDAFVRGLRVDTTPTVTKEDAASRALTEYGCASCVKAPPVTELWVLRHEQSDHLVYLVRLVRIDGTHDTSLPVLCIDAHNGDLVWRYDDLRTSTSI